LDKPTRENPAIFLPDGPARIARGYTVYDRKKEKFDFVESHDGPLLRLQGPHGDPVLMQLKMVAPIVEALELAAAEPPAAPGAHDDEIIALGFELVGKH
jgi:hypothetical protein